MKVPHLLFAVSVLTGCEPNHSANEQSASQSDIRPTEKIALFPIEPHQWRKDPDCYISKTEFNPSEEEHPRSEILKWQKPRHFSGYLYTNFEGWSFTPAKREENPNRFDERRYYASIYYTGTEIPFPTKPKTYWLIFEGREAFCNPQRPEDPHFEHPFSANLVIIDRIEALTPMR